MSGGITLTALASYAAIAGAAVSIGSSIYSAVSAPSAGSGSAASGAPQADATQANNTISNTAATNAAARTQLLETAGQSAGATLSPGSVGGTNQNTIFGN